MSIGDGDHWEERRVPWWTSCRLMLALIGFLGFLNVYALRADMSVAIVCMVNHTALRSESNLSRFINSSSDTCHLEESGSQEDGEFVWDRKTQGLVLGAFFWGYLLMQVPGGWLATHYGGKRVFGWCIFISSVATLITPLAASVHHVFLLLIRIIIGIGTSAAFPSMQAMWGKWAPPMERSKLLAFSYAGAQMGNVITFPIASLLCSHGFAGGWPSIFYVIENWRSRFLLTGGAGLIWFLVWMLVVSDTPQTHRRISAAERNYITDSLKDSVGSHHKIKARDIPWRRLITSMPVYAIIVGNTFSDWGAYTMMTGIPTYMKDVLKFDITSNGLYSALPYIFFWLTINISGWLADFVQFRGYLSTTWTRKIFQATGQLIPAVLLIGLGFLSCTQSALAVAMLTMGVAFTGPIFSGFIVNAVDIAPAYGGIIFGISNSIGSLTGFVAPVVTGVITQDGGSQQQWLTVFFVTAAIYASGAVFYLVFASGELQDWAREEANEGQSRALKDEVELSEMGDRV